EGRGAAERAVRTGRSRIAGRVIERPEADEARRLIDADPRAGPTCTAILPVEQRGAADAVVEPFVRIRSLARCGGGEGNRRPTRGRRRDGGARRAEQTREEHLSRPYAGGRNGGEWLGNSLAFATTPKVPASHRRGGRAHRILPAPLRRQGARARRAR